MQCNMSRSGTKLKPSRAGHRNQSHSKTARPWGARQSSRRSRQLKAKGISLLSTPRAENPQGVRGCRDHPGGTSWAEAPLREGHSSSSSHQSAAQGCLTATFQLGNFQWQLLEVDAGRSCKTSEEKVFPGPCPANHSRKSCSAEIALTTITPGSKFSFSSQLSASYICTSQGSRSQLLTFRDQQ